ncbi:hypothetical protein C8R44DRAFT_752893 [Mycena epipterygia]|nr:hypothetical protein C8R44DRAFT_752893 [Mycena epipterygia]
MSFTDSFGHDTYVAMALYWPCGLHPTRRVMPPEIWMHIFDTLCSGSGPDDDHSSYNYAIGALRAIYEPWKEFIDDQPFFWREVEVDTLTVPAVLRAHINRAKTHALYINLVFDADFDNAFYTSAHHVLSSDLDDDTLTSQRLSIANRVESTRENLTALATASISWKRLYIWGKTACFMSVVLDVLMTVSVPSLEWLVLGTPEWSMVDDPSLLFSIPPQLFRGATPALTFLDLKTTTLPWGNGDYFGNLTSLKLTCTVRDGWPTTSQLISTLAICTRLEKLWISDGGIKDLDWLSPIVFCVPFVTSLVLSYSAGSKSMLHFITNASMPALKFTRFERFTTDAFDILLANMSTIIRQLEYVTVCGGRAEESCVKRVLMHFTNVKTLNIAFTFNAWVDVIHSHPDICPSLQEIIIGPVPLARVVDWLAKRKSKGALRVVYYHSLVYPLGITEHEMVCALFQTQAKLVSYPDLHFYISDINVDTVLPS